MRLNLGCGRDLKNGWLNVDVSRPPRAGGEGVEFALWDLESRPWPVAESVVDLILAEHVVEHLSRPLAFFDEAFRVLKPDGCLVVVVPFWRDPSAVADPTHRNVFPPTFAEFLERGRTTHAGELARGRWRVRVVNRGGPKDPFWWWPVMVAAGWPREPFKPSESVFWCRPSA